MSSLISSEDIRCDVVAPQQTSVCVFNFTLNYQNFTFLPADLTRSFILASVSLRRLPHSRHTPVTSAAQASIVCPVSTPALCFVFSSASCGALLLSCAITRHCAASGTPCNPYDPSYCSKLETLSRALTPPLSSKSSIPQSLSQDSSSLMSR